MRVLITGGAGFIGSHTAELFLQEGWEVSILDNFRTGRRSNIAHLEGKIELTPGSVEEKEILEVLMKDVDGVVHLAAVPSVVESHVYPLETSLINVAGTVAVLEAARLKDVERVVFSSSSAVYGDVHPLPLREEYPPRPMSNYAVTKVAGEHFMSVYSELYGIKTVSLRYFNVYGPRQNPESEYAAVIPRFLKVLMGGGTPVIYGDGKQTRDFIYVKDVARANYLSLVRDVKGGEVINVASGRPTEVKELLEIAEKVTGKEVPPRYESPRPGDIKHSVASIEKMKRILGFTPEYSLRGGVEVMYSELRGSTRK